MGKELSSSVEKFKQFISDNPKIVKEVRLGKTTWQSLYEDWRLLGEEHEIWDEFRDKNSTSEAINTNDNSSKDLPEDLAKKSELVDQVSGYLKKIDVNKVQSQIKNLSSLLTTAQGVLGQFGSGKNNGTSSRKTRERVNPFAFRKD